MADYEDLPGWWYLLTDDIPFPEPTEEQRAEWRASFRAAREEYLIDPGKRERIDRLIEEIQPEWKEFTYLERTAPWRDAVWFELPEGTSYDVLTEGLTKLGYIERTEGLGSETRYRLTRAGRRRAEELRKEKDHGNDG
jgi:hypothetical protein